MPTTNEHGQQVGDEVPGWSPRPWPAAVRLEGRYVVLDPANFDADGGQRTPRLHTSTTGG